MFYPLCPNLLLFILFSLCCDSPEKKTGRKLYFLLSICVSLFALRLNLDIVSYRLTEIHSLCILLVAV